MLIFYKKNNINFYKKINDNQLKVLLLSDILNFRNSLINYCNSEKITDLINEIKNNDLIYYDQLLKIKKKIDIFYKLQLHAKYSDSDSDSDINIDSDLNIYTDTDTDTDIDTDMNTDMNTDIKDINTDIKDINTDINIDSFKDINIKDIKNMNTDMNTDMKTDMKDMNKDMNTDMNTDMKTYINVLWDNYYKK